MTPLASSSAVPGLPDGLRSRCFVNTPSSMNRAFRGVRIAAIKEKSANDYYTPKDGFQRVRVQVLTPAWGYGVDPNMPLLFNGQILRESDDGGLRRCIPAPSCNTNRY